MGKDSLLESTSKKKAAAKADKEKPAKKKTAAKKTSSKKTAAKKAAAAKKTTAAKTKKATAKKTPAKKTATTSKAATAKKTAPAKAKKTAKKAPAKKKPVAKKLTRKELLWKKIETYPVTDLYKAPVVTRKASDYEAPSFFAGMGDAEAKQAKEYLRRKFDWAEIKAAGEKYAAELAAKAEAEAKRKAEEEAKRKAEEEAKRKAEEEARRKAEEEARRKAEEEAKRKAEEEARRKAEEEARRKAEEEAKRNAEEEAKRKAEEEAKRKAEEEAKRKAEEEAKRKAEEEAKRKAEAEAKQKAAEQMPPPPTEADAGMGSGFNPIKIGVVGFCAIILLLVFSSYTNTKKYYIAEKDGAVEIWRGTFTPMGKTRLMIMPGIQMPAEQKDVYGWQDAYRLMYQYYIEKADAILEVPGVPDTAGLTANLEKAIAYAPDRELRDAARARMMGIRMQTLVHKAQAALNRGTIESATAAIGFLKEAAQYNLSAAEAEMVQRKIEEAEAILADREQAKAEAERAAAEQAALEAEAQKLQEASENPAPAVEEDNH